MTWLEAAGSSVAWAWRVLAQPVMAHGADASRVALGAAILTAGRLLWAVESSWAESVEAVGKKMLKAAETKLDRKVEQAKAQANAKRLNQVEAAKLKELQLSNRIKQAEEDQLRAQTEVELEMAKAKIDQVRAEAEATRLKAQSEALERLLNAMSRLSQQGGSASFSEESLRQFLAMIPALPAPIRAELERKLKERPKGEGNPQKGGESESASEA